MQTIKYTAKTIWHRPLGSQTTKFQRVMVRVGTSSPDRLTRYPREVFCNLQPPKSGIPIPRRKITQQSVVKMRLWDILGKSYPWLSGLQRVMVRVGTSSFGIFVFGQLGGDSRISLGYSRTTGKLEYFVATCQNIICQSRMPQKMTSDIMP